MLRNWKWGAGALAGIGLTALLFLFLVYVPRQVVYAARWPVTQSPSEVGVDYEDITLRPKDAALPLAGWWMPAEDPMATLVFIHGGSSNRHTSYFEALDFYREMVARNVSVVAIDLRNHGASGGDPSGIQFGLTEKEDAKAAVAWARQREPDLPLFAMGISMGGATLIYAAAEDLPVDGLILLDPLLDTTSCFVSAVHATVPAPKPMLKLSAWSAIRFFGLPGQDRRALEVGKTLNRPILLIQDPTDPVTLAVYAEELAATNPSVEFWMAPRIAPDNPEIAWKGRWGAHVGAFAVFPDATLDQIFGFMNKLGASKPEALSAEAATAL